MIPTGMNFLLRSEVSATSEKLLKSFPPSPEDGLTSPSRQGELRRIASWSTGQDEYKILSTRRHRNIHWHRIKPVQKCQTFHSYHYLPQASSLRQYLCHRKRSGTCPVQVFFQPNTYGETCQGLQQLTEPQLNIFRIFRQNCIKTKQRKFRAILRDSFFWGGYMRKFPLCGETVVLGGHHLKYPAFSPVLLN